MHIMTPKGEEYNYTVKLAFNSMNNEVEYEALLSGLQVAKALGAAEIEVWADSQVVVNQVRGEFAVKSEQLRKYLALIETERSHFKYFQIQQILRMENQKADKLACTTSRQEDSTLLDNTMVRTVEVPTVGVEVMIIQPRTPDWAASTIRYLEIGKVPEDRQKQRKVKNIAACYTMIEGLLYRQGHLAPFLRCISPKEAQYVLAKIHEGICRSHSGEWH